MHAPALLALVLWALCAPLRADFESDHQALRDELATQVESFARWCEEEDLLVQRNKAYSALLELDPEHVKAHEALGHRHQKDGSWVIPSRVKRVYDNEKKLGELAAELLERRRAAVRDYRDAAFALLDADPELAAAHGADVYAVVLAIDEDDAEVRARRGEARYGNAWVLAETARAYEHRPQIRRIVAEAVRRAGARETLEQLDATDGWRSHARTPEVEVFGSVEMEEALRAAQAAHATGDVYRRLFQSRHHLPADMTVYLLGDRAELVPFLERVPNLTDEEREFLAQLVGSGIPRTANTAQWSESRARRLDGVVRHTIGQYMVADLGLTTNHAWAWEGIGLYLTRELVGSRLTWYIGGTDENTELANLRADLLVQESNWMNAAWTLLKGDRAPRMGEVLRQNAGEMGVDGMLASYAFCAYLIEGRPDELPEVLIRTGRGEEPEQVVREALGMTMDELQVRVERWLSERRRPEYYGS